MHKCDHAATVPGARAILDLIEEYVAGDVEIYDVENIPDTSARDELALV